MEKYIKECLDAIPLNLKMYHAPLHNRDGDIVGGYFTIQNQDDNSLISTFILEPMKGCNGICISRKVVVYDRYRGKGYGTIFCKMRELLARQFNFSMIMCTMVVDNIAQQKILEKNQWEKLNEFLNLKTQNRVSLYCKKI
jgi:GNAT superfamily N-acetyltransferase